MPEYTALQKELLKILQENSEADLLSKKKRCVLKNIEIYSKLKTKTSNPDRITDALKGLERKGKIKINTDYKAGVAGRIRTIIIL